MSEKVAAVKDCIVKYKVKEIVPAVKAALDAGEAPETVLNDGMILGMNEIGEGFKNNTVFMPQMLMAAKTMQMGLAILKPLLKGDGSSVAAGKAVIGSVLGDVHDIGKNLVTVMLEGQGLDVIDLGADVSTEKFVETLNANPDTKILACSSSMTPTRAELERTVSTVRGIDSFDNVAIFVGGATMKQDFSDQIHADVYTLTAASAAYRAKQLIDGVPLAQISQEARAEAEAENAPKEQETEDQKETITFKRHLEAPRIKELKAAGKYDRKPMTQFENVLEMISKHDEAVPDAFVNQYFFEIPFDPVLTRSRNLPDELFNPQPVFVDAWGVTASNPPGSAGSHPEEGEDVLVIKDITKWKEQVRGQPSLEFTEEDWAMSDQMAADIRARGKPLGIWFAPGLFERTHFLMGMKGALTAYYEHPAEMHELIDWIADWEIRALDVLYARYQPEVLFHHDDWGSAINSFLDPATHREFFLEPYKRIYSHFKELGGKVVVHHSDSYAANLVPIMIDMGADIWQGPVSANNIPELIDMYGDRFVFMGGIDNSDIDYPDKTDADVEAFVRQRIAQNGNHSYIPCLCRGLYMSITPGIYDKVTAAIDKISKETF